MTVERGRLAPGHAGTAHREPGRGAGLRILLLDTDAETRNRYIVLAIRDALARQPEVGAVLLPDMLDAIALCRAERCDRFVAVGSARAQAPLLGRLCGLARRSVLWTTEDPYELASNVAHSRRFDHVFTNDLASVAAYGGRASHLPLAASALFQDLPVLRDDAAYRYDLLFIGTAWPNRVAAVDAILNEFPRARAKIGLSTNPYLPPVRLSRPGLWTDWRTSNPQFARLANASRVTLGLERRFSSADAASAKGSTPPPRLFEVALAGGYQVCLTDGEEAARYFAPDREFAMCHDLPGLFDAVRWALAHPAARIARAEAARARARREHLYDHRVRDLLAALDVETLPRRAAEPGRGRRVLVVTHNVLGGAAGGGIEVYQQLLRRIGSRFSTLFLFPEPSADHTVLVVRHPGGETDRHRLAVRLPDGTLHDAAAESLFQRILFECRIDLVHFQHLLHLPLSLPIIARASGVPTVFTLHDYHLVCSRLNLLDYRGAYCDPANLALTTCDICLSAAGDLPAGSQARRRSFVRQVLRTIDLLVANTPWSLEYVGRLYPDLSAARATVLEMCLPAPAPRRGTSEARAPRSGPLRVAIPGNFTDVKGGHQMVRLFNLMRDDAVQFTVLGALAPPFPEIFAALRFPNVSVRGGYQAEEIYRLLDDQEISLHLSIWPETYVISLSEAWASGVVPIVSRLGALGERVTDGADGFVVDPYDIGRIADLLRRFAEDRAALQRLADAVADKQPMTAVQHLAQLRELYERLIRDHPVAHDSGGGGDFQFATVRLGIRTNSARWDVAENEWDQPLLAPAPAGLDSDLPGVEAHVPVELASGDQLARLSLDVLSIDGTAADEAIALAAAGAVHRLLVGGWCYRQFHGPPRRRFVRLRGASFSRVYPAELVKRTDLAALFDDPAAGEAGFSAEIMLEALPPGTLRLDLAVLYDGQVVEYRNLARLDLLEAAELATRHAPARLDGRPLARLPDPYARLPRLDLDAGIVACSLDRCEGDRGADRERGALLSAGDRQHWSLAGWAFHPDGGELVDVLCRLRSGAAERLFALAVWRRLDVAADRGTDVAAESGFRGELAGLGLAPGRHEVDLLQVYERRIVTVRGMGRVTVLA